PITILQWTFPRDDVPRETIARQIALAVRDEVLDLEAAGARVIQVDEPGLREGLPLRASERPAYLAWAVEAFRLATLAVGDATQVQTHMCYADFDDIVEDVARMDADVILMEASRSGMGPLDAFAESYGNAVGPGVYDIHSPRVPPAEEMAANMRAVLDVLDPAQVWVNPDCG
ncbi:MAG: 5-methyltetrahydropteroyltriglutamate--homocysteine S-methyltransferase, partial [Solirubrobacterales bacterium]|nr:5-methyltetrahydropteroyltriglutamate--homocysteine S-methyltransferase [Solirubrobacterales bacterium]